MFKELLEYIIKNLVDSPDNLKINQVESEKVVILEVKVAPEDMGKIIGKQGKTIKAIRTLLNAVGTRQNKRVVLEVLG